MASGVAGLVAGLSVGMFTNIIKGALDYAGSLGEVAQQLGVTTRDLQTFRFAAGQLGVSQAEVDKGLGKLTITLGQVAAGAKAPTAALNAIGIAAKDVAGADTGTAFRMIADGLEQIPDRAQRAAVEVALFGRTSAKLDTLLSGGSKAINELSLAAEKLGVILSDEQIQKADETADKLDALKTVLSAQIAGAVANNADAILGLANALVSLVGSIGQAMNAWRQMEAQFNAGVFGMLGNEREAAKWRGANFQSGKQPTIAGKSVTIDLGPAKSPKPMGGGSIKPFLASGGGGGGKSRAPRDTSLRDAFQFDNDLRRADMDILQAKRDLARDYTERASLEVAMLDLERQGYQAELQYQVAAGEITTAQAEQLKLKFDETDALRRKAILQDEEAQRLEDYNRLADVDLDIQKEHLEKLASLAETASERRDVELRLLDLSYRQERARLDAVLADEQSSFAAKEEARRRLAALSSSHAADRQGVMQQTRGPLEGYLKTLPSDAAKMNEALEQVAVQGLQGLEDGILNVITGVQSLGDAFKQVASQIIADLLRIMIQKTIVNALGSALGGGFGGTTMLPAGGYASGGYTGNGGINDPAGVVHGKEFVLNAKAVRKIGIPVLNAMNSGAMGFRDGGYVGLPIARTRHSERVNVSNDNMGGSRPFVFNNYARMSPDEARRTGGQVAAGYRAEMNRATRKGF